MAIIIIVLFDNAVNELKSVLCSCKYEYYCEIDMMRDTSLYKSFRQQYTKDNLLYLCI